MRGGGESGGDDAVPRPLMQFGELSTFKLLGTYLTSTQYVQASAFPPNVIYLPQPYTFSF
jgi:hypothetical protein